MDQQIRGCQKAAPMERNNKISETEGSENHGSLTDDNPGNH
jgi:hypothetical protein